MKYFDEIAIPVALIFAEEVVTREARVGRKQVAPLAKRHSTASTSSDIREEKIDRRSRKNSRRDQIAPDIPERRMNLKNDKSKRRSSKGKNLKVDTDVPTPKTASTTPGSTPGVRSESDLRSPGQRKSPVFQQTDTEQPIPDFITQTDRYGNASTPRSADALNQARKEHPLQSPTEQSGDDDDSHVEACAETFLDSLRLVCCCLAPEESAPVKQNETVKRQQQIVETQKENVPRLLPPIHPDDQGKKCLVLDLDETLVHSSFRAVPGADFIIPVQVSFLSFTIILRKQDVYLTDVNLLQIEDVVHFVYVCKRPGVDEFLVEMAKYYEIVIYTASLNKYADPLLDLLDPHRTIRARLFRESCVYYEGNYVKDLSLLDRDISQSIIVDNSPSSYMFHPANAIDCSSFIDDPRDRELDQIAAFLKGIKDVKDVRGVCQQWREWPHVDLKGQ